jgi:hypothetical protein
MPGGSVYRDHTFNKETSHISHENSTIHCTNFHSTIQVLFFPWRYSPILGLGRLHETFRFISVTRSRIVGRTPWTGDQLVARTLLTAPGDRDDDDGEVGGMNDFGRRNRSTRRKLAPTPLCPTQIPLARPERDPVRRGGKPATNGFIYGAAQYKYMNVTKHRRKQKIQKKTQKEKKTHMRS